MVLIVPLYLRDTRYLYTCECAMHRLLRKPRRECHEPGVEVRPTNVTVPAADVGRTSVAKIKLDMSGFMKSMESRYLEEDLRSRLRGTISRLPEKGSDCPV